MSSVKKESLSTYIYAHSHVERGGARDERRRRHRPNHEVSRALSRAQMPITRSDDSSFFFGGFGEYDECIHRQRHRCRQRERIVVVEGCKIEDAKTDVLLRVVLPIRAPSDFSLIPPSFLRPIRMGRIVRVGKTSENERRDTNETRKLVPLQVSRFAPREPIGDGTDD